MLDKIRRCREMLDASGSAAELSVDGGVSPANAHDVVRAGARVLVAGSALFNHPEGLYEGMAALRNAAQGKPDVT
jgi:ribulose-phosphate 3-epimerase